MIKKYEYEYDYGTAFVSFEVDLDKFTEEVALETLNFFYWDWDEDNNPIDEVVKKYGLACLSIATREDYNTYGVISEMEDYEGFLPVDGKFGIKLIHVEGIPIEDYLLKRIPQ